MPTDIKCPKCAHVFQMEDAISEEYKSELRAQMRQFTQQKEDEFKRKLETLAQEKIESDKAYEARIIAEKKALKETLEENIRKSVVGDFENKLQLLEGANKENEERLKLA